MVDANDAIVEELEGQCSIVLELGDRVLAALRDNSSDALDVLEQYAGTIDSFERRLQDVSQGLRPLNAVLRDRLVDQHTEIVQRTETAKGETAKMLQSLRSKGRGLRAYADQYPKRISTIRPRKG